MAADAQYERSIRAVYFAGAFAVTPRAVNGTPFCFYSTYEVSVDYNFDVAIERRSTDSVKWSMFGDDVIPLWVADMDFRSPEPVIQELQARAAHGIFGYTMDNPELRTLLVERLRTRHHFQIEREAIVFISGLVPALFVGCQALGKPDGHILIQPPVYPPFLMAAHRAERVLNDAELTCIRQGADLRYEIDFDAFEAAITPQTRMFLLCNPHNPVGRVFTRAELERMAEICLRHDLIICSDEIHCDLILEGEHISIASLAPEIAERCVTLLAPSKTFNLAGLGCSFAVITNPALRQSLIQSAEGIVPGVNVMGFAAGLAAYREGGPWLEALLPYLRANRDFLVDYVKANLPGMAVTCPEGTYLAWLDCREMNLSGGPFEFFLKEAKVALADGTRFGNGGSGFVRLNFGCTRAMLAEGLERMRAALVQHG